jgi:glutathione S-transferase
MLRHARMKSSRTVSADHFATPCCIIEIKRKWNVLTIHHLGKSQSDRIPWLCEELGLLYELKIYARHPETGLAPPEYKALHPAGTAPIITDGNVVLAESGAVVEYLLARHGAGRLVPATDSTDFPDYLFWLHFANASLMMTRVALMAAAGAQNMVSSAFAKRDAMVYEMIDSRLAQVPYFAGDALTGADIMMGYPLITGRTFTPRDFSPYPSLRAYLARIGERPAFQRAFAKAEPGYKPPLD